MTIKQAQKLLNAYMTRWPKEVDEHAQFLGFLEHAKQEEELYSRKNYDGHITISAVVIRLDTMQVLLIPHEVHKMYLQPGGHVPDLENPNIHAYNEVKEILSNSDLSYIAAEADDASIPIDIDNHHIDASTELGEKPHYHYDFRYLFVLDGGPHEDDLPALDLLKAEWMPLSYLERMQTFARIRNKITESVSNRNTRRWYFDKVIEVGRAASEAVTKARIVVVCHMLPDALVYLDALSSIGEIVAIIPKPNSKVPSVVEGVKSRFEGKLLDVSRERLSQDWESMLQPRFGDEYFLIFDIGGWFSEIADKIFDQYGERFLGIIEDTENGYKKYVDRYRSTQRDPGFRLVSVARSPLKDNEDFLVGQSVLFSADSILRECQRLIQYCHCVVIGFGKIGESIAYHLKDRGITPDVLEIDPIRRVRAFNRVCKVPDRKSSLANADVVFCATGKKGLKSLDFRQLKPGCFVFSVTSSDDEFDLDLVPQEYSEIKVKSSDHVMLHESPHNHFFLVNKGNAVNFIHQAVLAEFIDLVRAEMIYAGVLLINADDARLNRELESSKKAGISVLCSESRALIAEMWLSKARYFGNYWAV